MAQILTSLEGLKHEIDSLPITPSVLSSLRKNARLETIHYSTYIEGNRLTVPEIKEVLAKTGHFPGRERDEKEILGYYAALEYMESLAQRARPITEANIQTLPHLVMAGGNKALKVTAYRDGQNVIRDSMTRSIVYLPPEAQDVPDLMKELVEWIITTKDILPAPLQAAIAHYQFATIHPYYDGNGRTARLLTTLILHKRGYSLKGIYCLEEYYAQNLPAYYNALSVGPSYNYYMGRALADITSWIEYFCIGMLHSFKKVKKHALLASSKGESDTSLQLGLHDARKRKALQELSNAQFITAQDIEHLFEIQPRTARAWCKQWVDDGFLQVIDPSKKRRLYSLAPAVKKLL